MKILVTGANGFIGKNLVAELKNQGFKEIFYYDKDIHENMLLQFTRECEFVFHLAGVNRPKTDAEFIDGNLNFTAHLLSLLKKNKNKAPIVISSSIQAELENPYGKSKRAAEELILKYSFENGVRTHIYRLPNVFGKWCRPNYNSAVATFCYNIANDLPIIVNDSEYELNLVYIDDVLKSFITKLSNNFNVQNFFETVDPVYKIRIGAIVELLKSFKESRSKLFVPELGDPLTKKLYSTYLSYLPIHAFSYNLTMHSDTRGSFTEFIKSTNLGQISINVIKPGVTKGNHWHHTKNEKFLVVKGDGVIRFRKVGSDEILEYRVGEKKLTVVDIPVGYVHNIQNLGIEDLILVIWGNEIFDKDNPDTFFEKV